MAFLGDGGDGDGDGSGVGQCIGISCSLHCVTIAQGQHFGDSIDDDDGDVNGGNFCSVYTYWLYNYMVAWLGFNVVY